MNQMEKALQTKKFRRWTVLAQDGDSRYMFCRCECGTEKRIRVDSLNSGDSSSCGCYAREQVSKTRSTRGGISKHRLYGVYHDAHRRCFDDKRKDYKHYGGRGITMCERWSDYEDGFWNFLEDMLPTWEEGLELEREDCNGDYEPSNCTWVNRKQQTNNLRTNVRLTYKGLTMTASEWGDLLGINHKVLKDRVNKLKWSDKEALEYVKKPVVTYYHGGVQYNTKNNLVRGINPSVKFPANYIKKKGGFDKFCSEFDVKIETIHEQRALSEVVRYLTDNDYNPEWVTEDVQFIKDKYKYYEKEDV